MNFHLPHGSESPDYELNPTLLDSLSHNMPIDEHIADSMFYEALDVLKDAVLWPQMVDPRDDIEILFIQWVIPVFKPVHR